MPQPTLSSVHIDTALSNLSTAYMQSAENFIAGKVFAWVPSEKQTNKFYTFNKNDFRRNEMQIRGPGAHAARGGFRMSNDSFYCDVFSLEMGIDEQVDANADKPVVDPKRDAQAWLSQQALINAEVKWVANYFATSGQWGTYTAAGAAWSDYVNSDPLDDVMAGMDAVLQNTGFMPNTAVITQAMFSDLRNHPDIREQVKYTSGESISEAVIAKYLGIQRLFVLRASYATNVENETAVEAFVGSDRQCLLVYANPSPSLMMPSAGYNFSWSGLLGAGQFGNRILRYEEPQSRSEIVAIEQAFDMKVVGSDLGYMITGC